MQLGIGLPSFSSPSHTVPADRFRRYARLADEADFAGAWLIEHLGENPNYATSLLDPLTTLSVVAGETETLPVGTSVLLLPLRNPVMVAKRAASLQHLSSRRVTLGLGMGYVDAEFDAVGVPLAERSERYLEGIELIQRLFAEDRVTYEGEHFSVEDFRLEPVLGQPPRLLAGGGGVDTDEGRRVARGVKRRMLYADGWIAPPRSLEVLETDWAAFASYLESQDRDPDRYEKVLLQYLHLVPGEEPSQVRREQRAVYRGILGENRTIDDAMQGWLTGTVDEVRATLADYERLGFDEVILHPVSTDPGDLDRQLRLYRDVLQPDYR